MKVRVGGIAKGSGMIHPNMATMLSVITSDVDADEQLWREVVRRGAINSFNQVEWHLVACTQVLPCPSDGNQPHTDILLLCSRLP